MAKNLRILAHSNYIVGWIYTLHDIELLVAGAMLDEYPVLIADL